MRPQVNSFFHEESSTICHVVQEPDGKGNRRRVMVAVPDLNVILMENYINPTERVPGVDREQQIWTYRYGKPAGFWGPPPASDVKVTTTADSATPSSPTSDARGASRCSSVSASRRWPKSTAATTIC